MDHHPTRAGKEPIPGLALREKTPARILVGRAGGGYRTSTLLELRRDHAAARDAIWDEIDLERDLPGLGLFPVQTAARDKHEYLLRPDLGRVLNPAARHCIIERCPREAPIQLLVGDGLSAAAVRKQVPRLLPLLLDGLRKSGESVGMPFFVRFCRVGVLNEVGELLHPEVVILLIGERPGLATAESLSAYMAYRPQPGDTDARRNLISNIHDRGVPVDQAARRILALARQLRQARQSGVGIKEVLPTVVPTLDRRPEHG
ncbi:MAG: ethanolamine ammonia-lyase subunit EutC [Gemmataceae bacterium]